MAEDWCLPLRTVCPFCGKANDHVSEGAYTGKRHPTEGDISICFQCHGIAVFENGPFGVAVRKPTNEESEEIREDGRIQFLLDQMVKGKT